MAITIKDVAKRAGVATSTVSRTLKDNANISEATKNKVRKAMKELGYVPNSAAQNLANRLTRNIGIILPPFYTMTNKKTGIHYNEERVKNPFFMDIVSQISQQLNTNQYTASLAAEDTYEKLLDVVKMMYQQKRVDGFILLYSIEGDAVASYLLENNIPFVMIGMPADHDNEIRYVDNDNVSVGRTATKFLIDKGHEKIAFIGTGDGERVHQERYDGYFIEMQKNQLLAHPCYDVKKAEEMHDFIQQLECGDFSALVVSDDMIAVKLIPLLANYGYDVGENFSIISINNSIFSTLYHPYLTTVDIHIHELAKQSADLIIALLQNPNLPLTKYIIPHHIVRRETVLVAP